MLTWILALAAGYALVVGVVYVVQDALVFAGSRRPRGDVPRVPGVEVEFLEVADPQSGQPVRVRLAVVPPGPDARGVVVFFLGNGEDLREGVDWAAIWRAWRLGAVVMEYPGYGESTGPMTVPAVLAAARAAARRAARDASVARLPLFSAGQSLGTFAAVHVAARGEEDFAGLLLRAPPGHMAPVAQAHYPWLPARLLLRHRFDALVEAPRVRIPCLIVHGDRDRVAPIRFGRRLADAMGGPTRFVPAQGHDHYPPLDVDGPFAAEIGSFLDDPAAAVR